MNIYERPTPRTDEAAILRDPPVPFQGQFVRVEFARRLEQELETCRDAHMANCLAADTLRTEIHELRERMDRPEGGPIIRPGWVQIPEVPNGAMLGLMAGEYLERPTMTRDQARTVYNAILAQARTLLIHTRSEPQRGTS